MNHTKKALTLSIVVPCYDEEEYIGNCLESIANQTVQPSEVIVVDNNCTDRTITIAKIHIFVKVIKESKQGILAARTTGLDAASSDIVARIDADTRLPRDWVKNILASYQDEKVQAACGPSSYWDAPFPRASVVGEHMFQAIAYHIFRYKFLRGNNMTIRRITWQKVKPKLCERNNIFEDMDIAHHLTEMNCSPSYLWIHRAAASARRYNDGYRQFYAYISKFVSTARVHRQPIFPGVYSMLIFILIYALVGKVIIMAFYEKKRRLSLKKLFSSHNSRPDPMSGSK